jgi:hypothetical protein
VLLRACRKYVYITAMSASRFVRVNERQQNRERALLVYPQLLISFHCGSNVNVDASKTNTDASISVSRLCRAAHCHYREAKRWAGTRCLRLRSAHLPSSYSRLFACMFARGSCISRIACFWCVTLCPGGAGGACEQCNTVERQREDVRRSL